MIRLTIEFNGRERPVLINPTHIISVDPHSPRSTSVVLTSGIYHVTESLPEIESLLAGAPARDRAEANLGSLLRGLG